MKKPTLTEIRRGVESKGGTYEKCSFRVNGNDAYRVNGELMTKAVMIERFMIGDL